MAAVKCSKCGEELLGAVNRCWRCGQTFAATADNSVVQPVSNQPIDTVVVDQLASPSPANLVAGQKPAPRLTTAELIDARRAGMMAMGGTVTSLVLGVFSAIL